MPNNQSFSFSYCTNLLTIFFYLDAIEFLSSSKPFEDNSEFTSFQHGNACWKLLNTVAESGNVENVQKLFDLIVKNNYISVSNVLLGPLIKVHIIK